MFIIFLQRRHLFYHLFCPYHLFNLVYPLLVILLQLPVFIQVLQRLFIIIIMQQLHLIHLLQLELMQLHHHLLRPYQKIIKKILLNQQAIILKQLLVIKTNLDLKGAMFHPLIILLMANLYLIQSNPLKYISLNDLLLKC